MKFEVRNATVAVCCLPLLAALLPGCGSSSDNGGSSNSNNNTNTGNTSSNLAAEAAKYVGKYHGSCEPSEVYLESTGEFLYQKILVTVEQSDPANSLLNFWEDYTLYGPADTTCTGADYATLTDQGVNTIAVETLVSISGQDVAKISVNDGPYGQGFSSANNIILNGLVFPGDYFSSASTYKDLLFLDGKDLYIGDDASGQDADGYPLMLESSPILVKE